MSDIATFQIGSRLFVQCQREGSHALRLVREVLKSNVPSWIYPERFAAKLVAEIERRGDGAYILSGFPDIVTGHPIVQVWCGVSGALFSGASRDPLGFGGPFVSVDTPSSSQGFVLIQQQAVSAHVTFDVFTSVSEDDAIAFFRKVWK